MDFLKNVVYIIVKRPFVILFFALIILILALIGDYIPIFTILSGLSSITNASIFESIISYLQFMLDPGIIPMLLAFLLLFTIAAAGIAGLVFSGYFNILNNAVAAGKKAKGEYLSGLRKYFIRVSLISARVTVFGFLFIIFMLVASVPSIVISRAAATDKPELLAAAIFVDILTAGIIFFGLMFFRLYMLYWYPAAINNSGKYFSIGKQTVDRKFWSLTGRFVIFDAVYILFQFLFTLIKDPSVNLIVNWLFRTCFFTCFVIYIFYSYRKYSGINGTGSMKRARV